MIQYGGIMEGRKERKREEGNEGYDWWSRRRRHKFAYIFYERRTGQNRVQKTSKQIGSQKKMDKDRKNKLDKTLHTIFR